MNWLLDFLKGKWLGHPLHPILAHVPMAMWLGLLLTKDHDQKTNLVVTAYIRGRTIRRQASVGILARLRRARLRRNTKKRCSISNVAELLSEHRLVVCAPSGVALR